ncbi:hypothetical protein [Curtobacterium sp. MCSS17_016]|uniref:hypothetical protein n=1 Tax=Curtobacterium sp. MCSS17_016 TaxID=2175644 RepID=UPI000DA744C7|nr:hypothetical protein [Curtobacterium sp. MCSS17_016]WIE81364.1 hypothetical protein DEJ19_019205 [Curtobacterium sp. MCSS17_016]
MTEQNEPEAVADPAPVALDRDVARAAIVAFIDAHRAERRLYPETYADRMADFLDQAHRDGVPKALKQLRKELPK